MCNKCMHWHSHDGVVAVHFGSNRFDCMCCRKLNVNTSAAFDIGGVNVCEWKRVSESNLCVYETDSRKLNRINLIIMCSNLKFMETHGVTASKHTPVSVRSHWAKLPRYAYLMPRTARKLKRQNNSIQFNFPSILMPSCIVHSLYHFGDKCVALRRTHSGNTCARFGIYLYVEYENANIALIFISILIFLRVLIFQPTVCVCKSFFRVRLIIVSCTSMNKKQQQQQKIPQINDRDRENE